MKACAWVLDIVVINECIEIVVQEQIQRIGLRKAGTCEKETAKKNM
jgi:hypothetical protein